MGLARASELEFRNLLLSLHPEGFPGSVWPSLYPGGAGASSVGRTCEQLTAQHPGKERELWGHILAPSHKWSYGSGRVI